jgi:hypothetical protein
VKFLNRHVSQSRIDDHMRTLWWDATACKSRMQAMLKSPQEGNGRQRQPDRFSLPPFFFGAAIKTVFIPSSFQETHHSDDDLRSSILC